MAHVEGGEKYYIRKEYAEVSELGREGINNADKTGSGVQDDVSTVGNPSGDSGETV